MNLRHLIAATALLAAATATTPVVASPVTYQLSGGGVSWSTDLTANINYSPVGGGGFSEDVWVGPLSLTVTNLSNSTSIVQTVYCTDIFDDYESGGTYRLGLLSQTAGQTTANKVDALLSHVTPNGAIEGAALQAVIWKLENNPGNNSITSGIFSISPDGITGNGANYQAFIADANTYLRNVNSGVWRPEAGTTVLQYTVAPGGEPNQTFSFLSTDPPVNTPEPASLALLGSGMVALVGMRRRLVRRLT
jgi:hypothetical protein